MKKLLVVAFLVGCGGSSGTVDGNNPTPTLHALASNQAESVPANQMLTLGPFTVPAGATVDYSIVDTPTGVGVDTMDVGVATNASAQTASPVAYGIQNNVSSTTGSTPPLPAATYDLLVQCVNVVDNCIFDVTLTATY